MEVHPGIFVSSISATEWQADPEVGGDMHVLVESKDGFAGMSRFTDTDKVGPWTVPVRETFVVLEGAARLEIEGASTVGLGVGDMVSIPEGAVVTWHLTLLPYKELWFFGTAYDVPPDGASSLPS
jgi:uncharacterized cupin superfamily protein